MFPLNAMLMSVVISCINKEGTLMTIGTLAVAAWKGRFGVNVLVNTSLSNITIIPSAENNSN